MLISRSWNLLFSAIYESQKIMKVLFNFFWFRSLFVFLYIFCGIGAHSLIKLSIFCISANVALIKIKEKAGQSVGHVKTIIHLSKRNLFSRSSLNGRLHQCLFLYLFFWINVDFHVWHIFLISLS